MNVFLEPFQGLSDIDELNDHLRTDRKPEVLALSGVTGAGKALVAFALGDRKRSRVIVTAEEQRARELYEEYLFYDPEAVYYPGKDLLFFQSDVRGNALTVPRVRALAKILSGGPVTVITTIGALMNRLPAGSGFTDGVIRLRTGDVFDLDELRADLVRDGYEPSAEVAERGEFAVRGGIVDVFPLTEDAPYRIEFFGDEVDSIREFDPATQRSGDTAEEAVIWPAMEFVLEDDAVRAGTERMKADAKAAADAFRREGKPAEAKKVTDLASETAEKIESGWIRQEGEVCLPYFCSGLTGLLSYMPEDALVILDEGRHIGDASQEIETEFTDSMERRASAGELLPGQMRLLGGSDAVRREIMAHETILLSTLDAPGSYIRPSFRFQIRMQQGASYNGHFDLLLKDIRGYVRDKDRILLISPSRTSGRRLAKDIADNGLTAFWSESYDREIQPGEIMVSVGQIAGGFIFPDSGFAIIAESDIFGKKRRPQKKHKKKVEGRRISTFRELSPGDYVVHENHGIGIYRGMEKIEVDGVMKDYIKIEYAKGSNLYVLATQLDSIQKYADADAKKPRLSVLGGQEWAKTKSRVKSGVGEIAKELVELYAVRQQDKGYVYGPDTEWQREFEEAFPYEETEGQLAAIADVKADMESPKIMDRLICGDVGYGKTEVAMRAAFKAVQEGKQVAVLVPTTILAEQHYGTFSQRMKNFAVNIGELSRFRTPAEQKETLKLLAEGRIDIVIGTHRLLSKDVKFKDLGLLIIDEEQRFGVAHKEKIKELKQNVDVLSMSATPIPRTLHMSLAGIRDMSLLEEAPEERQPIQTFVFEYNDELIREAIARELARNGQVYYVINRVRNIADVAAHIQELVPEANVTYAHGQMNENQLEDIMMSFINKETDVLVATTIIEIGIDIPNVNTIIIHDADRMGLSQLYQLRGRVGRSSRTAYAFFLYRKDRILKEDAEKRLSAIREFTDLGSGFKIAMRDLEIRGAGNVLGRAQHGHMEAVGYDLYAKMLNEAVKKEKGEAVEEDDFETTVDIGIDAYIPKNYISDELQRLDVYKRIADIETEDEYTDMLDELIDRFGEPPRAVQNLLLVAVLRRKAKRAYITEIRQQGDVYRISLYRRAKIDPAGIPAVLAKEGPAASFRPDAAAPYFTLDLKKDSRLRAKKPTELLGDFSDLLWELTVGPGHPS